MTTILKFSIAITLFFLALAAKSQELNGSYSGNIEVQGMQMELIFNITPTDKGFSATLDVCKAQAE